MIYRILRNNKEQGPYNLDELLQLSLRPHDLIWVEGRSASWRYPSEVETLIPHLDITSSPLVTQQKAPLSNVPHIKKEPLMENVSTPVIQEQELTAAILEHKANAIYQRIQAYNAQCEQEAKDVQTKYARSLEDLKQDYADWLHKKKRRHRGLSLDNKGWMALGAMCTAFVFFILAGRNKDIANATGEKLILNSQSSSDAKVNTSKKLVEQSSFEEIKKEGMYAIQPSSIDQFIDSVRRVLNKKETFQPVISLEKEGFKSKAIKEKDIDTLTLIIAPTLIDATQIPLMPKPSADMNAYYILNETSDRLKEIHVTVNNTGNMVLKQVAVEVSYFKKNAQILATETLYFTNINPGNAASISKPGLKKAITVQFEMRKLSN